MECVKKVVPHGDGVLVSHIINNGKHYIVIVNHSPYLEQEVDVYMDTDAFCVKEYPLPMFEEAPSKSELSDLPLFSMAKISKGLIGGEITFDKGSSLHLNFKLGGGGFRVFEFRVPKQ